MPDLEPDEMTDSCALDVADRDGVTLEDAGNIMNITRERVRQLEVKALAKVQAFVELTGLRDWNDDEGRKAVRRLPVISTRFLDEPESTKCDDECEEAAE